MDTDNSVVNGQRKGGDRGWLGEGRGMGNGDICTSINNKNKQKKLPLDFKLT